MEEPITLDDIPGIGDATVKKLRQIGITTIEALAVTPIREITDKTDIGPDKAFQIVAEARKHIHADWVTAQELYERRKGLQRCSTGSKKLDALLGGGIETQAMTEMIGEYAVGKTQLCLKLCVMVQLPVGQGGLEGSALFIDTEGTFSPERVYNIAAAMGLETKEVLNKIIIARAYTSDHQSFLIDNLLKICSEENVKLVVVDSMISHFRGEYVGRENLAERQQKLNQCLHKLLRLAEVYNIAVVITNQVQANPAQGFGDPNRPAGGHILAHACTHRVYITKAKGGTRQAKIIDSPYLPESKEFFIISDKGIEDAPSAD